MIRTMEYQGPLAGGSFPEPADSLERIAIALERIAKRLDSWDSEDGDHDGLLSVKLYKDFT